MVLLHRPIGTKDSKKFYFGNSVEFFFTSVLSYLMSNNALQVERKK